MLVASVCGTGDVTSGMRGDTDGRAGAAAGPEFEVAAVGPFSSRSWWELAGALPWAAMSRHDVVRHCMMRY